MKKQAFGKNTRAPLSPALRVGNVVFVSGQVPVDPETGQLVQGGIEEQTRQVLENIKRLLAEAGASMSDVVKTTVLMTDISQFAAMNQVYREYFPDVPPTRSTFEVKLAVDALIEIEAIAVIPDDTRS